ncbi:cytochrome P450 [Aspergillus terricola var. indicus]
MDLRFNLVILLLVLTVLGIAARSRQRFLSRRQFARRHGCQPVAKCSSKSPFLGLDTIPGTIRAVKGHRILQRGCELFRQYGNTFTFKELHRRAVLTIVPQNIKTILSLSFARDQVADLSLLEGLTQDLFVLLPRDGRTIDLQGKELRGLKYTQHCVDESLRLHPVVSRNERRAIWDTVLPLGGGEDGLTPDFVPKGTLVAYNIYAMHRRADLYGPDAEEFRPERWEDGTLQPRWGYLPFNGGPRICIGQRYALTEVSYVLFRMVQKFRELESRDSGPWEESLALTLCSRNGTKVGLIP